MARIVIPILLVIKMHIGPTKLLKDDVVTIDYDSEKKLCGRFQSLDWGDNRKIEKAVAGTENKKDKVENS